MRTRRIRVRTRLTALVAAVTLVGSLSVASVLAVHDDGVFELDRNALDDGVAGDDWENIFDDTDSADATTGIDFDGRGPTIFTGGGSKDDLNTTGWKHKNGSVPDKDELLDAFAARYDDVLYFGADRYDASGAAALGFWFFQEEVGPVAGGSFGPGQHKDGDILVLSDFSVGGGTVTIRVFMWNGPGGDIAGQGTINGVLDPLAGSETTPADCVGPPEVQEPDPFCATVNDEPEDAPWDFNPKGTAADIFAPGELYEGGIDLTAFPQLTDACFSSFLAETRTSPSVGSQLKDFVAGGFEDCEASVTTTPSDADGDPVSTLELGDSIHDYALIEGTGSNETPTGTVAFSICAPDELDGTGTDDPDTCDVGGTLVSTNAVTEKTGTNDGESTSDAFEPDSTGTWCWRGEYSGDDLYPEASDASDGECFDVVDGKISLTPLVATNETGTNHTITATVQQDTGSGFVAAPTGTVVSFSLLNNNASATFVDDGVDSDNDTINGNDCVTVAAGTCTIQITSTATGTVDIRATATFTVGGLSITRTTTSTGTKTDANKRFVDAQIDLSPLTATNNIGDNHVITATVQQNDGLAANTGGGDATGTFGPAPNGTVVVFSFVTNDIGATFVDDLVDSNGDTINGNDCVTAGGTGTCTITIHSSTAGSVVVHATTTFNVGPAPVEEVTRATGTGGLNSADAQKTWVSGSLAWTKDDNAGNPLGGATFQVCRTDVEPDDCFSVTDNSAPDTDDDPGEFLVINLELGDYSVTETDAPDGYVIGGGTQTKTLTFEAPSGTITVPFVNNRPVVKITGFGYTNAATANPPTSGVLDGSTTYTVALHNYGLAAATLSSSSLVVSNTGTGTVTCDGTGTGGLTKAITGTIAASGNLTPSVTLNCTYTGMSDGAVITATLNVKYTTATDNVERTASGSPATISFTVQGD